MLDLDTDEPEAMRMAGLVSPIVAERLAETLMPTDGVDSETNTSPVDNQ